MPGKLKLNLDHLAVESFDTSAPPARKGTVYGEQCTCYTACTCPGCPTCDPTCGASCNGTCDASCNGTCAATCNTCGATCYSCYTDCDCFPETCLQTMCGQQMCCA